MLVSLFVCTVFNGTSAEKAISVKNRLKKLVGNLVTSMIQHQVSIFAFDQVNMLTIT